MLKTHFEKIKKKQEGKVDKANNNGNKMKNKNKYGKNLNKNLAKKVDEENKLKKH